jgi:hypothetical protein
MTKRRSSLAVWLIAVAVASLPLLYALSVGPCGWLYTHGYLGEQPEAAIDAFYAPLKFVLKLCPPLREIIVWYASLWR